MGKKNIHVDVCEGNLTRDAELKTIGERSLAAFSVAVNDSYKDNEYTSYYDFEMWGRYAEAMGPYLKKGTHVVVDSRPKQQRWEKDGSKRSKVVFMVDSIRLVGGQKSEDNEGSSNGYTPQPKPTEEYDDDIPF
jgi:single-strand DNA-binding protein